MANKANDSHEPSTDQDSSASGKYTVVARRYRPKTFSELVGQSTVAQALLTAIQSNRVGHAYLFTGARGVGKTSTARIFAKALNASTDGDGMFDPNSEVSLAIDSGEDMDVLEIDGASNRGIDEIRQLRANAAIRPSRSKYKIYIIDEVHMLTTQAFNALLKTLEEPPGHVKFIFCTTDPEKIPITVLSRCQRFDFPPVSTEQIFERLKFICKQEGSQAEDAALRLIARRAAGSMRDSQSLLEQLLSFGGNVITAQSVHDMLGIADEARLESFVKRLMQRDAAGAFQEWDGAVSEGVDVGQLADQLLGYLRDIMLVSVGGSPELMRTANPNNASQMAQWGQSWGSMTLLSSMQILDETMVKMRHSVQSRVLMEIALVQICHLQDLQSLSEFVKAISTGGPAPLPRAAIAQTATEPKKKLETLGASTSGEPVSLHDDETTLNVPDRAQPVVSSDDLDFKSTTPIQERAAIPLESENKSESVDRSSTASLEVQQRECDDHLDQESEATPLSNVVDLLATFQEVAKSMGGFAKQCAEHCLRVEQKSDSQWMIQMTHDAGPIRDYFLIGNNCHRLAQAISHRVQQNIRLVFNVTNDSLPNHAPVEISPSQQPNASPKPMAHTNQSQLIREAMSYPLVKKFVEVFGGEVIRVDPAQIKIPAPNFVAVSSSKSNEATTEQETFVEEGA